MSTTRELSPPTPGGPGGSAGERGRRAPRHSSSRAAQHAAKRAFRPRRTVPAVVAAAVLFGAGGLAAAGIIAALVGSSLGFLPSQAVTALVRQTSWSSPIFLAVSAAVAAVGVVMIMIATVPGRPRLVALATHAPHLVAGATRASVRRVLARAATEVDGVADARVKLRRRRVAVRATSRLRDTSGLAGQVHAAVEDRLGAVAPLQPMRVKVRARRRGD